MSPKRISVMGPINADIMVIGNYSGNWRESFDWADVADISFFVAGSSGYTLQDFQLLGNKARIFASVGDDAFGVALRDRIAGLGIDSSFLSVHRGGKTAIAVYWLMHGNKKRPMAYNMSNFEPWPTRWDEAVLAAVLDADLLHCGGYLHYPSMYFGETADVFRKAKQNGLITSIDTQFPLVPEKTLNPWVRNMTDILPYVDVLITDEDEALALAGEKNADSAAKVLLGKNTQALVIKFGRDGSRVYTHDGVLHQPAVIAGETVDTIGAGDAYGAAFMTYFIEGKDVKACARFASAVAGFSVTKAGGIDGIPDRKTAEHFLQSYSEG